MFTENMNQTFNIESSFKNKKNNFNLDKIQIFPFGMPRGLNSI